MIRYARRKPKRDLFILWLGISTMAFGVGGATLRGISAVKATPVLIDSEPTVLPVSLVEAPPTAPPTTPSAPAETLLPAGGDIGTVADPASADPLSPEIAAAGPADEASIPNPFEASDPLPLLGDAPAPLLEGFEPDDAPIGTAPEPATLDREPEAPVEEDSPPEPVELEPTPEAVREAAQPSAVPAEPEAAPPEPAPEPEPTPKREAKPPTPKPAPRAEPVRRDSKVAVQRPKVLYRPNLRFPQEAQRRGIGGSLELAVHVNSNGRPDRVRVTRSSGHRILDNEAIAAVRAWRFEPAKNAAGKPLPYDIKVPVNFGYPSGR